MIKHTVTVGDVFDDLGFSAGETVILKLRADLMAQLDHFIKTKGLTQADAAKMFGISQPRVSNLVRGRLHLFSIDMLLEMAIRAGLHPAVAITQEPVATALVPTASLDADWETQANNGGGWQFFLPAPSHKIEAADTALAEAA